MLDAAHQMVEEAGGISVSLDRLAFDDVFERAAVSRSSAYRAWSSQDEFYLELLRDLAGPNWRGTAAFDQETIELAAGVIADNLTELATPAGRTRVIREAVRLAAHRNFIAVSTSAEWRTYVALTATLLTLPQSDGATRDEVRQSLMSSEKQFMGRMAEFYENMSVILGFKLRPEYPSFSVLAGMGAAVVEGLALRQIIAPDAVNLEITIQEATGPQQWSLPALGFMAILDSLIELDPRYDANLAIAAYLKRMATRPT